MEGNVFNPTDLQRICKLGPHRVFSIAVFRWRVVDNVFVRRKVLGLLCRNQWRRKQRHVSVELGGALFWAQLPAYLLHPGGGQTHLLLLRGGIWLGRHDQYEFLFRPANAPHGRVKLCCGGVFHDGFQGVGGTENAS